MEKFFGIAWKIKRENQYMGQEGNARQVIIPLDEYNKMTAELANIKSFRDSEIKTAEEKISNVYKKIIGNGVDVGYIQSRYRTYSEAILTLERYASTVEREKIRSDNKIIECTNRIDKLNNIIDTLRKDLDEKKQHELYWREMYYMLVEEKKLRWWQIFKRIKLRIRQKRRYKSNIKKQ